MAIKKRTKISDENIAGEIGSSAKTVGRVLSGKNVSERTLKELRKWLEIKEASIAPGAKLFIQPEGGGPALLGVLQLTPKVMHALFGENGDPKLTITSSGLRAQGKGAQTTPETPHGPSAPNGGGQRGQGQAK